MSYNLIRYLILHNLLKKVLVKEVKSLREQLINLNVEKDKYRLQLQKFSDILNNTYENNN